MARTFNDEILESEPRYTLRNDAGGILNDNVDIELKTPAIQEGTPLNKAFLEGLFTYEELQVEKKDASYNETITASTFFNITEIASGNKILDFNATAGLYDGNEIQTLFPTMTLKTSRSGGWVLDSEPTGEETGIYATIDGSHSVKIDSINSVLNQTALDSDRYLRLKNASSSYDSTKTFVFDFKKPKEVTFNFYSQGTARTYTFSGSDDNSTWDTISSFKGGSAVSVSSGKAYRYYQLVTGAYYDERIYYMYFSQISDEVKQVRYENAFTSTDSLLGEKEIIVKTPNDLDNTNVIKNTLNGIEIDGVLVSGERYRLLYNGEKILKITDTKIVTGYATAVDDIVTVELGFKPKLVICYNSYNHSLSWNTSTGSATSTAGVISPKIIATPLQRTTAGQEAYLTDTGFVLNTNDFACCYIAFN